jgi:poly(3-hydroxybutyrate) depolymerase
MVFRTLRVMSRARTWPMLTALLATSLCVAACKTKGVGSAREADVTYLDGPDRSPTFEASAKPGDNYEQAEFRLWLPDPTTPVRALVVLLPGSNDDGRDEVRDPFWQAFAVHHRLGLVGCRFVDKPHEPAFIEQYANASKGSGQALVDTLGTLARESSHAEIDAVQILLWGMSAGGEYDFEFAAWRPERVLAFVVAHLAFRGRRDDRRPEDVRDHVGRDRECADHAHGVAAQRAFREALAGRPRRSSLSSAMRSGGRPLHCPLVDQSFPTGSSWMVRA